MPSAIAVRFVVAAIGGIWATPIWGAAQTPPVTVASAARVPPPPVDTAIAKLEAFLVRYPDSPLRPNALFELGELLVRRADEQFAATQRSSAGDSASGRAGEAVRPNYAPAISRYEELVRRYPNFDRIDAAAYTLGTLYSFNQRHADAVRMFETVASRDSSRYQSEALFRLGDAYFELAAKDRGEARRAAFAKAASAYERATARAPQTSDIHFLALYKLGWAYYNQATRTNQAEYGRAVEVFGRLVDEYDRLTPEQQARLGLRGEALEYMAIAFTQIGGAEAANRYFAARGIAGTEAAYRLPLLRRVAASLRDQGDFTHAVGAYRAIIAEAPTDSGALDAQREVIDIYQNRTMEPEEAQAARLELIEKFAPGGAWATASPSRAGELAKAREDALRQSAQYTLAAAQKSSDRTQYAQAASLYDRYLSEFPTGDSAQVAHSYYAEALFGQGDYVKAGAEYMRAAYEARGRDSTGKLAQQAGQNAIVAYDSALVHNRTSAAAQDSLFAAVDRYVATFPESDVAKKALIAKARRASETQRWEVMATTFRTYATRYPNDPYTPTAQRLIGDALYKQGQYADAQVQWDTAQVVARRTGRRALADTIARVRTAAADAFADTLVRHGDYRRAAEEVYVAYADKNPGSPKAPDALRDAIETYMIVVDSGATRKMDASTITQARDRAVELSDRLVTQYPNYKYRLQYQSLHARLLADAGRREEAVAALGRLVSENPRWPGRADAMIQMAVTLDSLGRKKDAAAAYERFAGAYATDRRAADAQYNAAVTYVEAGDSATAARAYGTFVQRFPRDPRVAQARELRVGLLTASGDTATAGAELARLCANPTATLRATCAARLAESSFRRGVALWPAYQRLALVVPTKSQLTAKGVQRASARKQQLLTQMTTSFRRAIETGNAEYLSAATFYTGLAQWEYGNFLKNVKLPAGLSAEEQAAAQQGSARQAEQYYQAARQTWQALIDKATQEKIDNKWIGLTRDAIAGNVPSAPPTALRPFGPTTNGAAP